MMPKVSIIVPVYNVEKYLKCCIDSLLNQTLKDIEIILVDDSSPDHCPAICDKYAKQDSRVKVIHKKNEGYGYARNSGLEIATGEYITFVDSDDYVELNAYRKLYDLATETKTDVVYFACQRFDDHGNVWREISFRKEKRYYAKEEIRGLMLDMVSNPPKDRNDRSIQESVWSGFYRQDVIKKYGLKSKSERDLIGEDLLFNLDYLSHSSSAISLPDTFYNWRATPLSFTRSIRPDRITISLTLYRYLLEWLRINNFGRDGYLRATRLFIGYSRVAIRQYVQSPLSKKEKIQWLKETVNMNYWKEIASSYPYRQLPLKYALHFYLLYKGFYRSLYCLSSFIKKR